jgi:phage-related holin
MTSLCNFVRVSVCVLVDRKLVVNFSSVVAIVVSFYGLNSLLECAKTLRVLAR